MRDKGGEGRGGLGHGGGAWKEGYRRGVGGRAQTSEGGLGVQYVRVSIGAMVEA